MKFAEFLRTPSFTEHLQWLFVAVSGFQPIPLLKKRFPQRYFSVNFAKFLRTSFDRTPPDDYFLSLSVNFKKFFWASLLWRTSEKPLISCIIAEFQPADTMKNYFTDAFQAFCTRASSSHLKAFIYLK